MKIYTLLLLVLLGGLAFSFTRTSPALPTESFHGMADASALEILDQDWFVVASDEDNLLRIYHRQQPEAPVRSLDLSPFLRAGNSGKKGKSLEVDLEGCTRLGDIIFWISSHGRDAAGEYAASRHRLLATKVGTIAGIPWVHPVGAHFTDLVEELLKDQRFAHLGLAEASQRAPKSPGGLNIEGLASTPTGGLLIGFRSPIPDGQALVVPLLNPLAVIEGAKPRFADPVLLPLDGQGIRGLANTDAGYWILAGSPNTGGTTRLFRWTGGVDAPSPCLSVDFSGLNPEGISLIRGGAGDSLVITSDDGALKVDGREAKRLKNPSQKSFRLATITVPPPSPNSGSKQFLPSEATPLAQSSAQQP